VEITMMPKGVEHGLYLVHKESGAKEEIPTMPQGVEHPWMLTLPK